MSMIPEPPFDEKRVYDLPLDSLFLDNSFNCRGPINPAEVMELAKDITTKGLLSPIVVQPWNDPRKPGIKFRIVAGHRRYVAFQQLILPTIPSLIKPNLTEIDARIFNLVENIQRTNLNVLQEAQAIEHLKDAELPQQTIAERIGKSRGWVQERVYLLDLPDDIQKEAAAGQITMKQVRQIWALPSTQQQYEYVRALKDAKIKNKKKEVDPNKIRAKNEKRLRTKQEIEEMQDTIREYFGNGLATTVLGWVIAANSDLEMHQFIQKQMLLKGRFYAMPEGLSGPAKTTESPDDAVIADDGIILGHIKDSSDSVPDDDSDLDELLGDDPEDQTRGS